MPAFGVSASISVPTCAITPPAGLKDAITADVCFAAAGRDAVIQPCGSHDHEAKLWVLVPTGLVHKGVFQPVMQTGISKVRAATLMHCELEHHETPSSCGLLHMLIKCFVSCQPEGTAHIGQDIDKWRYTDRPLFGQTKEVKRESRQDPRASRARKSGRDATRPGRRLVPPDSLAPPPRLHFTQQFVSSLAHPGRIIMSMHSAQRNCTL
jgi:hypothetical protein